MKPVVDYTKEQLDGFTAEAAARRKKVALAIATISLPLYGVAFALAKKQVLGIGPFGWLAIAAAVAVVAISTARSISRCPACGARVSLAKGVRCSACGVQLG